MAQSDLAGKPAPREIFVNVPALISAYYTQSPNPDDPAQGVSSARPGIAGRR